MFDRVYKLVQAETSGENARNMVAEIWRRDITCSFDEFHKTAQYCVDTMLGDGASEAEIIAFPATGKAVYGAVRLKRAWDCKDAELTLVAPQSDAGRLLSYRDDPYVLAPASPPTPKEGIEAPVVILEGGDRPEDYEGVDVKGKLILTDLSPGAVHELAKKQGAVGIITDNMQTWPLARPTPMDLADGRCWQYSLRYPEGKLFAFVLTPREGKNLRALIAREGEAGREVRMHAWVDSRLYDGKHEMVSACIKGRRTDQEVALIAHLFEPGANDNASGAAVCMEVVRALKALIHAGKLPRPYRTIRVWLVHEFESLSALAHEQPEAMDRVFAAANVDFVGHDQCDARNALTYQDAPDSLPSFVNHFTHALMDYFRSGFYTLGSAPDLDPYFATVRTGYNDNDNFISDPSIGVPSIGFINWPDRNLHSNQDTIDKVHAPSIARVAALIGTWAYMLASARDPQLLEMAEEVAERAYGELADTERDALEKARVAGEEEFAEAATSLRDRLAYRGEREIATLDSIVPLLTDGGARRSAGHLADLSKEIADATAAAQVRAQRRLDALARERELPEPSPAPEAEHTPDEDRAAAMVPSRKIRGLVRISPRTLPPAAVKDLQAINSEGIPRLMLFWVDGERSLLEICRLAGLEDGRRPVPAELGIRWAEAMKRAGVITIKRRA